MKTDHLMTITNTSDPIWASNVEMLPPEEYLPVIGNCQISSILQNLDGTPHDPHNLQNMDLIILNATDYKPLTDSASSFNYIILKDTPQPADFSKPQNVPEKIKTPEKTENFEDMLYFVCNMCPYLSTKDSKITDHIESAHKNKSNSRANLSNFKCPACTNIFHHRSSLKFHLLYDHYVGGDELDLILQAVLYYSNKEKKKTDVEEAENLKVTKENQILVEVSDSSETDKEPELTKLTRYIPRLTPSKMMLEHDSSSNCSNSNSTEYFEIHSPGDRPPSVLESTPKKPKILQQNILKYPIFPRQLIMPSIVPSLEWEQTKGLESHSRSSSLQTTKQVLVTNSISIPPPNTSQPQPFILNGTLPLNNQFNSIQNQSSLNLDGTLVLSSSSNNTLGSLESTPVPINNKVILPQVDITPKNGERLFADNTSNNENVQRKMANPILKFATGKQCIINTCKVRMNDVTKLNYHIGCHTDGGFKCMECEEKFVLWKPLTSHLWRFHKVDMELYSCDKCDYKTFSLSKLNNIHKLTHGEAKNFQCDICKKFFKNAKQVHNHKEIHKEKTEKPSLKCEACQKSYTDKRTLRIHMDSVHKKLKPFLCSYCGYKGPTRASLKMHIRLHTGEKPFSCDECAYTSSDHNSLRRHKLRHTGQKPYKCTYCNYACIQSSTYKAHLKTKHPGLEKDLMFTCVLCQFRTINKEMYVSHLVTVHHQEPPATL